MLSFSDHYDWEEWDCEQAQYSEGECSAYCEQHVEDGKTQKL